MVFYTSNKARLAFFWRVLKKQRVLVFATLGLEAVLSLLNALMPYFTKFQVDQLEQQQTQVWWTQTLSPFLLFAAFLIIPALIELVRLRFFEKISRKVRYQFDIELQLESEKIIWEKLASLDAGFFDNRRNQQLLSSAFNSTRVTNDFFNFIRTKIGNVISILAIFPLLGLVSWQLLLLVAIVTLFQLLLAEVTNKQELALEALQSRQREKYWRIERALIDHFHTLMSLGATENFLKQYRELSREREVIDLRVEDSRELLRFYEWILQNLLTIVANLFVGFQVLQGNLTIGTFTLVLSYTLQLNGIFKDILGSIKSWKRIEFQLDRLQFFTFLKPRIHNGQQTLLDTVRPSSITAKNIHFTYPTLFEEEKMYLQIMIDKTQGFLSKFKSYDYDWELKEWQNILNDDAKREPVLQGVDLKMEKGKIVALLGRNGAGKTTMTHLLMHHYEPTSGDIMIDDHSVTDLEQSSLSQQFAIIQQRPFVLYQFSLRDNLLLGTKPGIKDEEIWEMLEKLDLANVVKAEPKQLDTIIGEGFHLSGGQEQLIAVARTLLQRRPFIIFDEGMNQMDIEHETKVMSLLKEQAHHSAILFITHRITTARKADHIYVLDQGKIVEEGSHRELLEKEGLYAAFWKMQVIE